MIVLFKDLKIGEEFCQMGLTYIKKSTKTGKLKNGKPRDWDYFSGSDEVKVKETK